MHRNRNGAIKKKEQIVHPFVLKHVPIHPAFRSECLPHHSTSEYVLVPFLYTASLNPRSRFTPFRTPPQPTVTPDPCRHPPQSPSQ